MKMWKLGGTIATTAVLSVMLAGPAAADSGKIYSGGGGDCVGMWISGSDQFWLADLAGGGDDDSCYIDYSGVPEPRNAQKKRLTIDEDSYIGQWQKFTYPDLQGVGNTIYFRVCEERQNDPDLCSNIGGYAR